MSSGRKQASGSGTGTPIPQQSVNRKAREILAIKNTGLPSTIKSFLQGYAVYLGLWLAVAQVALTVNRDHFVQNWYIYQWVTGAIILLPFLFLLLSIQQGSVAKWFRLLLFSTFRVETVTALGLSILTLFTILFLRNLIYYTFQGEQIFLNVLFLNLFFMLFLGLVLAGKFQIEQPTALLIQKSGDSKVYLYENRVIRHIPDPMTLKLLGHSLSDVVKVSEKEFNAYTLRPAIESVADARIVLGEGDRKVWMIFGDVRRHIPDPYTLNVIRQLKERPVETIDEDELRSWKEERPLASLLNR
jgi:hypothetical protein